MARKWLKKVMPKRSWILNNRWLQKFGSLLNHPKLWLLNRRSAMTASALGGVIAFVPMPGQTILVTALAIMLRVNLPLSIAGVFLTNPLTMPFLYYLAYKIGAFCLHINPIEIPHEAFSFEFLKAQFHQIGLPFLLGSLICGLTWGVFCYASINFLWRYSVKKDWQNRKRKRADKRQQINNHSSAGGSKS